MTIRTLNSHKDVSIHPHRVLAKVERLLGLRYLPHQWSDLLRLLKPSAQELGLASVDSCLGWLEHESQTEEQVRILAKHLTIGESYFFREIVVIALLRDVILPSILRRKSEMGDSVLRIWSAGCSTGEEVYTIGIIIASLLREDSGMRVHILGTDINPSAIDRAERGVYRDWSFRDMGRDLVDEWFVQQDENRYRVNDRLRSMVEFRQMNLVDVRAYPASMDIILCRNVLMYFTRSVVQEIVQGFRHTLRPDGWLVPSMTETTLINQPGFEGVRFGDVTLFRHQQADMPIMYPAAKDSREVTGTDSAANCLQPNRNPFKEILPEKLHDRNSGKAVPVCAPEPGEFNLVPSAPEVADRSAFIALLEESDTLRTDSTRLAGSDGIDELADQAKMLADAGKLDEALVLAEKAVTAYKMNPYGHYIYGTILRELGETQRAMLAFDRALYLDPQCIPAHFGIGALYRFLGKREKATRHLGNALALVEAMPDQDSMLLWSDMTARNLAAIIRSMGGGEQ